MDIHEAKKVISTVPNEQLSKLDAALERYKRFAGIYTAVEWTCELAADRAAFPHLLSFTDGMPVLSDERCVEFMSRVSGLPPYLCAAWNEIDFHCDSEE